MYVLLYLMTVFIFRVPFIIEDGVFTIRISVWVSFSLARYCHLALSDSKHRQTSYFIFSNFSAIIIDKILPIYRPDHSWSSVDCVKIMNYNNMYNCSTGPLVMCDTPTLHKLLSQYLVTDDVHLIVYDLDSTQQVTRGKGILCSW